MLEQMLVTFMEGAVICLGAPYILKLCKNVFDPWLPDLDLPFWKSENKDSPVDPARDMVEHEQVLRTTLFSCLDLQTKNSLSAIHFQRCCHFLSAYSESSAERLWCDQGFLSESELVNFTDIDSVNNSQPVETSTLSYRELRDFYHRFKMASSLSAGASEGLHCDLTKMSHDIWNDKLGYFDSSDTKTECDSKVPSFTAYSDETDNMNEENMSMSDCAYNKNGQLVRMFLCFNIEHSDTSSVVSSSDSGCKDWDSDCEDFIIFDNSCADEGHCCTRFDFEHETNELHQETFVKSVVFSSNLYCKVSVMESFDNKLDSFVQEMLQPNLYCSCEELILNKIISKDKESKGNEDFASKTVSQVKRQKKVCFKPDNELAVVHPMVVWNFAYRQARKGTWEADALDRLRFKKRIEELEEILTPVLLAKMEQVI